jgi:hypothetical protein
MSLSIDGAWTIDGAWSVNSGSGGGGGAVTWATPVNVDGGSVQFDAAYNGTNYVTIGSGGYHYSTNATTWSTMGQIPNSGAGPGIYLSTIAYGNGRFVATGPQSSSTTTYASTSTTGTGSWSAAAQISSSVFYQETRNCLAFGNGTFVLVGDDPNTTQQGYFSTSTDGSTWTTPALFNGYSTQWHPYAVIYDGSQFVAVGSLHSNNYPLYSTSADGTTWTTPAAMGSLTAAVGAIAYGNGTYVAILNGQNYTTSTNLTSWTTPVSAGMLTGSIAYGNGQFVAVGYSRPGAFDVAAYSVSNDNGATWTGPTQFPGTSNSYTTQMYSVNYLGSYFIATGRELGGAYNVLVATGS